MPIYDSINGVARKVTKLYDSVGGVARQVTKVYDSVGGVARQSYSSDTRTYTGSVWVFKRNIDPTEWKNFINTYGDPTIGYFIADDVSFSCPDGVLFSNDELCYDFVRMEFSSIYPAVSKDSPMYYTTSEKKVRIGSNGKFNEGFIVIFNSEPSPQVAKLFNTFAEEVEVYSDDFYLDYYKCDWTFKEFAYDGGNLLTDCMDNFFDSATSYEFAYTQEADGEILLHTLFTTEYVDEFGVTSQLEVVKLFASRYGINYRDSSTSSDYSDDIHYGVYHTRSGWGSDYSKTIHTVNLTPDFLRFLKLLATPNLNY